MRNMTITMALGMIMMLSLPVRADTTEANVIWNGENPAAPGWDIPANWTEAGTGDNKAPANPTPGTLSFATNGLVTTSFIEADRQVGGLSFDGTRYGDSVSHTIDLNEKTLTVAGNISRTVWGTQTLRLTNGTLRIGTDTVPGNINMGVAWGTATLALSPGMVLDAYDLRTIALGAGTGGNSGKGYVNLRGVEVVGGVLSLQTINIQEGGRIYLDDATLLSRIAVADTLVMRKQTSYIGNPSDSRLPAGIALQFGVSPSARGNIHLGRIHDSGATDARLAATGGGDFTAYLDELNVIRLQIVSSSTYLGILDIGAMTNCLIDATLITVGSDRYTTASSLNDIRGELTLCPGTVTGGVVEVGATLGVGWGRLALSNTMFTVTNSFTLNRTADMTITLGAEPLGLDVDGDFIDESAGTIGVHFMEAPAAGTTNWAIRVAGDAVAILAGMVSSEPSRLTATGTFAGKKTGLIQDGAYTYYAMVDDTVPFPPVAAPHAERTYEIAPDGTVELQVADIDNGSYDPEGRPITVTISSDGVNFSETLSFAVAATNTVTLKIEAGDPVEDATTATCTVHIVDPHPGSSTGNRTWIGEASTILMDRPEWMWSGNWLEGTPPAAITTGTINFREFGQSVTGIFEADRQVGGLNFDGERYGDPVSHTINLNEKTLTVAGNISRTVWGTQTLRLTNGTLRIGTDTVPGNINMNQAWGTATLALSPGMVLDAYDLRTIALGAGTGGNSGKGYVNLRGVEVVGGVLSLQTINIQEGGRIYLDDATLLSRIAVADTLVMRKQTSYIGNPSDSRLPAGIALRFGVSPSARGNIHLGRIHDSGATDARLAATGGGDFTAYLGELDVTRLQVSSSATYLGILDIGAMTNCLIDATLITVGSDRYTTPSAANDIRGELTLCPGTVTGGVVEVGATLGVGWGRLALSNTLFTVTDALTIAKTGDVEVDVGTMPTGIDITNADPGAFSVDAAATVTLRFLEPAARLPHYGFRWTGDHTAALETLRDDGRITIDSNGLAGKEAQVFLFQGATHVGIPPPRGTLLLMR